MGEQAEKSWKQKFKFLTLEDDFLPKIRISNTTKKCNFPKLAQYNVWFFLLNGTTMYQDVLSCKKNSQKLKNRILNAMVLKIKFWKKAREIFRFCVDVLTHLYCLKMLQTLLDGCGIKFWWFSFFLDLKSDPGSKVSPFPLFYSKIVIIIMNWTSITTR